MKKTLKKLILGREILRTLGDEQLSIVGGGNKPQTVSGCVTECHPSKASCQCSADVCTDFC